MNEEQHLTSLLDAMPLQPLPVGLTARIMDGIRPIPTFAPFRLTLSDVLLALAATVLMIIALFQIVIPVLQGLQPTIDFSQWRSFSTSNLTFAFLLLLELLLGSAIYLSLQEPWLEV